MSLDARKPVFAVSYQVRHKRVCAVSENGQKLGFRKKRNFTIRVVKPKALISFAVTANLICAFVFAYAKFRFSHDAAHIIMCGWLDSEPLFLGRLRPERLTSNQIASQHRTGFHWGHNQPIYFLLGPKWVGAPVSVRLAM